MMTLTFGMPSAGVSDTRSSGFTDVCSLERRAVNSLVLTSTIYMRRIIHVAAGPRGGTALSDHAPAQPTSHATPTHPTTYTHPVQVAGPVALEGNGAHVQVLSV